MWGASCTLPSCSIYNDWKKPSTSQVHGIIFWWICLKVAPQPNTGCFWMGKGGEFHSSGDLEFDFVCSLFRSTFVAEIHWDSVVLLLVGPQIICFQVPHVAGLNFLRPKFVSSEFVLVVHSKSSQVANKPAICQDAIHILVDPAWDLSPGGLLHPLDVAMMLKDDQMIRWWTRNDGDEDNDDHHAHGDSGDGDDHHVMTMMVMMVVVMVMFVMIMMRMRMMIMMRMMTLIILDRLILIMTMRRLRLLWQTCLNDFGSSTR